MSLRLLSFTIAGGFLTFASPAIAQEMAIGEMVGELSRATLGEGEESGQLSGRIIQLVGLMTMLSLAPGLLVVMTSFTRFVIVLSILRSALGLNQSPPNMVITSLALFMTFFVMQPVFEDAWNDGLSPLIDGSITEEQSLPRIAAPFHKFMIANTRDADLALFHEFNTNRNKDDSTDTVTNQSQEAARIALPENRSEVDWAILVPAFMISELKRSFTIGFLIYLPFIAIDLIVAAVLMGAGMMMLSPIMVSLPFKIIFFVLIDGWYMLAGSLMQSYINP
jgi:flagellar biosynthetic protein FliP